jgi:hypothetical protein
MPPVLRKLRKIISLAMRALGARGDVLLNIMTSPQQMPWPKNLYKLTCIEPIDWPRIWTVSPAQRVKTTASFQTILRGNGFGGRTWAHRLITLNITAETAMKHNPNNRLRA